MAAALTATNGPACAAERAWRARAASSFPVPLSPVDEDGGVGPGHLVHDAEHLLHAPVGAYQVLDPEAPPKLLPQSPVLVDQAGALERARDGEQQHFAVEGLR